MPALTAVRESPPTLRRELGKWDLAAVGINQVIGSAVFILPSQVAAQLGSWSPIAFFAIGLVSLLVASCFAEVSSRFEGSGGPYLYTRAAFGRFIGFEVGWMAWITRVTAQASVVNAIALALGFYWPIVTNGSGRALVIAAITLTIGWINLRGIRHSKLTINVLTIAKLVPLALFILVGIWFVDPGRLAPSGSVSLAEVSTGALLLVFAFGGYEVIGIPAGEATDPRRHLPFAFVATILVVTAIMALVQIVAMGTLPNLAASRTPVAEAALLFMGGAGALIMSAGSVVSMAGTNMGQVLTGSRMLFALAESGELPGFLATIHQRYRTPSNAIVVTTCVTLILALSGSFSGMALASGIARLVIYAGACAATLRLRHPRFVGRVPPATFVIPFGSIVPAIAIATSLLIVAGATRQQLFGGAAALVLGAALFLANARFRRRSGREELSWAAR